MKYNYVYFQANYDYYRFNYADVINTNFFCYIDSITCQYNNAFIRNLCRIHCSPRFQLPFKQLWYPTYFIDKFKSSKPICFIVDPTYLGRNHYAKYLYWLKRKYKDSKFVLYYEDLKYKYDKSFELREWVDFFDLLVSYDKNEASKFNMLYHPTVSSYVEVEDDPNIPECDVYMLIQAKDRFAVIKSLLYQFTKIGLRCDFYVSRVAKEDRVELNGLHYLDNPMSYEENLKHVKKAKAILELMQKGAVGYTLRLWEAILYDKKLLTNNTSILESEFYKSDYIKIISTDNTDNISVDINYLNTTTQNPFKYKISPNNFLLFLEKELNK